MFFAELSIIHQEKEDSLIAKQWLTPYTWIAIELHLQKVILISVHVDGLSIESHSSTELRFCDYIYYTLFSMYLHWIEWSVLSPQLYSSLLFSDELEGKARKWGSPSFDQFLWSGEQYKPGTRYSALILYSIIILW